MAPARRDDDDLLAVIICLLFRIGRGGGWLDPYQARSEIHDHALILEQVKAEQSVGIDIAARNGRDIDVAQPGPSVESQVHWRRAMKKIVGCLRAAGPRTAQVVELSCLHDLTHPEIADRLGVTTRTVERCMQRARQVCEPFYIAA